MKVLSSFILILAVVAAASAQRSEVTLSLSEQFFDTALDAVFQHGGTPEFQIGDKAESGSCRQTIRLLREVSGIKSSVRFRDGRILAPLAFTGSYSPPFVGCVDFSGWADTVIDLEFDERAQRLVAKARVTNVSLNGTGGIGGGLVARMVQSSIDKKINPIPIIGLDRLDFGLPVTNGVNLRMRAVAIRHEVVNNLINVTVTFEFLKG